MRRLGRLERRVGRPSRRLGRWLGGRPRVFFLEGFPLFSVPARRRLGRRAAGAFFVVRLFFLGFCVAREAPALQAPEGGGVQLRQGAFFPLRFSFFFPLAWQDRVRVELAVKARSSSLGCRPFMPAFFFPCQDEKLNAAETRASVAEARVLVLKREKARPFFFFGVGRDRKPVLQVDLMKEIASQARFPSFFSPLFGGVFPGQAAWRSWRRPCRARKPGRRASRPAGRLPPPPCPPVAPRQADAIALRRELEQLKAHPSAVEIDRLRFRAGLRGAAFEAWPWPRTPSPSFSPFFLRSIPRRSVSPGRPSTSASTWKKRSGPRPFFFGFFQCRAGT